MRKSVGAPAINDEDDQQHLAWLARSFGGPDYAPLNRSDLETLLGAAELVSKYPGTHLFREGDPALSAFLMEHGEAEVYRGTGSQRRVVSRVGPGSILGDISMFGDGSYISSAQAVTRVRVFRFERSRLLPELARNPAVCLRWLVAGLRQFEGTQRRVLRLMHKPVLYQVADLLAEESRLDGDVALSQSTMATLLGVSRQSVNEALSRLREDGIVETGYREIRIVDRDRLVKMADY